jgi:cysteine-rich repeat protein
MHRQAFGSRFSVCGTLALLFCTAAPADADFAFQRVSISSTGLEANGSSGSPRVSANGRFVAFVSFASNLVPDDVNGKADAFLHDRQTGATTRVGPSEDVAVSGDGRYIAFGGVSVYDRVTGLTQSVVQNGHSPSLSSDGGLIAFIGSQLLPGDPSGDSVYVVDRVGGTTERIGSSAPRNVSKVGVSISGDGRYVAFVSLSALVPEDTNGIYDVYVLDRETGELVRASVSTAGNQANGGSYDPAISSNGRYVAFDSFATNLVVDDTNGIRDAFVHDLVAGETIRVSIQPSGSQFTGMVYYTTRPVPTDDGRYAVFEFQSRVYRYDRVAGASELLSVTMSGDPAYGWAPVINGDGTYVAFSSTSGSIVAGDHNGEADVFINQQCGDGAVSEAEGCDDGNASDGDGCSSSCVVETCYTCTGEPSTCTFLPDGTSCEDSNPCTTGAICTSGQCGGGINECVEALCPGAPDPCVVTGKAELPPYGEVDFGGRAFRLGEKSSLRGAGNASSFTLRNTASITLDSGSTLLSAAVDADGGAIRLESAGPCVLNGKAKVTTKSKDGGGNGGTFSLSCNGITIGPKGTIEAAGVDAGGEIYLDAGSGPFVAPKGSKLIVKAKGKGSVGGQLEVRSQSDCTITASIDASGKPLKSEGDVWAGDGGSVDITCDGEVRIGAKAKLKIATTKTQETGTLTLVSTGNQVVVEAKSQVINDGSSEAADAAIVVEAFDACTLGGKILSRNKFGQGLSTEVRCSAVTFDPTFTLALDSTGGQAGSLSVESEGSCVLAGKLTMTGKSAKSDGYPIPGYGNTLDASCASIEVPDASVVNASAQGGSIDEPSLAGAITLIATGGPVTIGGKLLAGAKQGEAGPIKLTGIGVEIQSTARLDASGMTPGSIALRSENEEAEITGDVLIAGDVVANGVDQGGRVDIEACNVEVGTDGLISTTGTMGGSNALTAHTDLTVAGSLTAERGGMNILEYRDAVSILPDGAIRPVANPNQNAALTACL